MIFFLNKINMLKTLNGGGPGKYYFVMRFRRFLLLKILKIHRYLFAEPITIIYFEVFNISFRVRRYNNFLNSHSNIIKGVSNE